MEFLGSRLVKILDLGVGGNLYGGRLMETAIEHAAIFAAKKTGHAHLVGYRFTDFFLTRPIKAGEILDFYATDEKTATSSITFRIEAKVNGERALSGECTFVAVDENGKKTPLP